MGGRTRMKSRFIWKKQRGYKFLWLILAVQHQVMEFKTTRALERFPATSSAYIHNQSIKEGEHMRMPCTQRTSEKGSHREEEGAGALRKIMSTGALRRIMSTGALQYDDENDETSIPCRRTVSIAADE